MMLAHCCSCYSLPARLDGPCHTVGVDIGMRTANIYMLLHCQSRQVLQLRARVRRGTEQGEWCLSSVWTRDAVRVRVDESAAIHLRGSSTGTGAAVRACVMAYSAIDGSQTVNYTAPRQLTHSTTVYDDLTLIALWTHATGPPPSSLVADDLYNSRFVMSSHANNPTKLHMLAAFFPNRTYYYDIAFSFGSRNSSRASTSAGTGRTNGTYFVARSCTASTFLTPTAHQSSPTPTCHDLGAVAELRPHRDWTGQASVRRMTAETGSLVSVEAGGSGATDHRHQPVASSSYGGAGGAACACWRGGGGVG